MVKLRQQDDVIKSLSSPRRTRQYIKHNKKFRMNMIIVKLHILVFLGLFGIAWSHVNLFYYLFAFSKILVIISVILLFLFINFDSDIIISYWKDLETRKKIVRGKLVYTFVEIIKLFAICIAILIFLRLTGVAEYWEEQFNDSTSTLVSYYQPVLLEGFVLCIVIILDFFAMWTAMYWFIGRFFQIKGYSYEKKIIKTRWSGFIISVLILTLIFWVLFGGIDLTFIGIIEGDSFEGTEIIRIFFEPYLHWIPVFEIPFLLILIAFFRINGQRGLTRRRDFVILEEIEINSKRTL